MSALAAAPNRTPFGLAGLGLGAVLILACGAARLSGVAAPPQATPAIATVALTFADAPDGGVIVRDVATGRVLETVAARDGGFLRSTMRVMATERAGLHLGPAAPFQLTAMAGNRLQLTDTATGQSLELEAFGPSNAAEFAAILAAAEPAK